MLNIDQRPTFIRTVTVSIPSGRERIEQTFSATYEALDNDEFAKFDLTTADGTKAFLERVIIGLDDIADADGKVQPYSPLLRDRLINRPWARQPLYEAYTRGVVKAAEGN